MSNIEQAFKNEDVEPFIIFLMVRSLKDHLPRVDYESNIHDAHESDDEKKVLHSSYFFNEFVCIQYYNY